MQCVAGLVVLLIGVVSTQFQEVPHDLEVAVPSIPTPCTRRTGGYQQTTVTLPPKLIDGVFHFFWHCRISTPSWSKCSGNCGDSSAQLNIRPNTTYVKDCKCCRPSTIRNVCPVARCFVFRLTFPCVSPPSWRSVTCRQHEALQSHSYSVVSGCSCQGCSPAVDARSDSSLRPEGFEDESRIRDAVPAEEGDQEETDQLRAQLEDAIPICPVRGNVRSPARTPTRG